MKKALALILALTMALAFASCGNSETEVETTTTTMAQVEEDDTAKAVSADPETTTAADGSTDVAQSTEENITGEELSTEEESSQEMKMPETTAEILAEYTKVMNYVKTYRPGFKKVEYQELPKDKRDFSNDTVLNIAANFMTSKEKATENPEIREKGYDAEWFPIYQCSKGCMLTDVSAIKSAKCEAVAGGKYKITIVLNAEMNPEPPKAGALSSPSYTGAMFSPLSKDDIDDTLENNRLVNVFLKSATYSLKYYDCTAILVYNPANNQIDTLTQYMHVLITADAKLVVGSLKGSAVLDNSMFCTDFKY